MYCPPALRLPILQHKSFLHPSFFRFKFSQPFVTEKSAFNIKRTSSINTESGESKSDRKSEAHEH